MIALEFSVRIKRKCFLKMVSNHVLKSRCIKDASIIIFIVRIGSYHEEPRDSQPWC